MHKISVLIITKNEQDSIAACVKSAAWADEVVVVDSYSTDDTLIFAKENGARTFLHEWEGYAQQKNWGISQCINQWILWIDADEVITPELRNEILNLPPESEDIAGYEIPRLSYFSGHPIYHSGWYPGYVLRLFDKTKGSLDTTQLVHEHVKVNGKTAKLRSNLLHYTYASINDYIKRQDVYALLWAEENTGKKTGGFIKALLHAKILFLKNYILKLGFLDGYYGLLICSLASYYTYKKYLKLGKLNKTR
ncbi:MAG: glycosyltransferase family 2 protein [Elusimicrobiota bacterium]